MESFTCRAQKFFRTAPIILRTSSEGYVILMSSEMKATNKQGTLTLNALTVKKMKILFTLTPLVQTFK